MEPSRRRRLVAVSALATISAFETRRLDPAAIARADCWRSAPAGLVGGDKEWTHFSVMAPQFDLIANFNLTARIGERGGDDGVPAARAAVSRRGGLARRCAGLSP